jgi:hydroxymethylbilane synthase
MMGALTVATRGGDLAIAQTEIVIAALKKTHPGLKIRIKKVTTEGDRDRRTALWNLKSTGFFTSQVEDAVLAGQADFAVHSFKDLPTRRRDGLTIAAVCQRQFPEDCLISARPVGSIDQLGPSAKIGTSSLRRLVQIKRLRLDLTALPARGNVSTRIRAMEAGEFDAIILARAGIERLQLTDKVSFCFDPGKFVPAPAQGALAVQTRTDDMATNKLISAIDDEKTRMVTLAERQILTTTQCGCHAPVGAFAKITGDDIIIDAFISDLEGANFIRQQITAPAAKAMQVAEKLAADLLEAGGREILQKLER